jgi:histidine triad (HIT) family protein
MHNHADATYVCSICEAINGTEGDTTWIRQADIFYRDDLVMALITSKFIRGNEGHVLVVPVTHVENLYDMPATISHRIIEVAQKVAIALKEVRQCDGVTTIQNNEPAGDQHAFHYHMHVIPRFAADNFHVEYHNTYKSDPAERVPFANALREHFNA